MAQLVLIRHGQSSWNQSNQFTGWTDVDLTSQGIEEAQQAGKILHDANFTFDIAYTSVLKRAIRTLWIVLVELDMLWIPVEKDWRLNERHYGALQGLSKAQIADQYGMDQVFRWRRSFDIRPPLIDENDQNHPRFDRRYADINPSDLPSGESLKDTLDRVLGCWNQSVLPDLMNGKRVLLVAHGNSLRALVKHLDHIPDEDIPNLSIPMGIPIVYELDQTKQPIHRFYVGEPEKIRKAVEAAAIAAQVKGSAG